MAPLIFFCLSAKAQTEETPQAQKQDTSKKFQMLVKFDQELSGSILNDIGYYRYFRNYIAITSGKLKITVGAGLLNQASTFDPLSPSLRMGADFTAEYFLSKHWSLYVSGRYFSNDLLNNASDLNPMIYDPMFMQSEIEAGIKGQYGDFEMDLGVKRNLKNNYGGLNTNTLIQSSFSFKF
ncbi:MAG: hypothetical protein CL868_03700 [Cytophagaceae bacterium]|nr:hypothetical protein [Cytophagaceae bacterium]